MPTDGTMDSGEKQDEFTNHAPNAEAAILSRVIQAEDENLSRGADSCRATSFTFLPATINFR